jgi:hypothetical protein
MYIKKLLLQTIHFLFFTILILNANNLNAQDAAKTEIVLKSGEKINGKVIEAIPDQYVKLELSDGTIRRVASSEIQSMETTQSAASKSGERKKYPSVIGSVKVGYDISSKKGYVIVEPSIVGGFRMGGFRMGAGVSFIYGARTSNVDSSESLKFSKAILFLPAFANFHFDFGKKKIKPSLNFSIGYPVGITKSISESVFRHEEFDRGGDQNDITESTTNTIAKKTGLAYVNVGVGFSTAISKKLLFNTSLHYQLLAYSNSSNIVSNYQFNYWNQPGQYYNSYSDSYTTKETTNIILHNVGVTFSFIY